MKNHASRKLQIAAILTAFGLVSGLLAGCGNSASNEGQSDTASAAYGEATDGDAGDASYGETAPGDVAYGTGDTAASALRHVSYTVATGDDGAITVEADVDTAPAEKYAPVASVSRQDFTVGDMRRIADALFDDGEYQVTIPYACRTVEDLKTACADFKAAFVEYEDVSEIPYNLLAAATDANDQLEYKSGPNYPNYGKLSSMEADGQIRWYENVRDKDTTAFCDFEGSIDGTHYWLSFLKTSDSCTMALHQDYSFDIAYGYYNPNAQAMYDDAADVYANIKEDAGACTYTEADAMQMANSILSSIGYEDYIFTEIDHAETYRNLYDLDESGQPYEVTEIENYLDLYNYNSYILYGGRTLNGLSAVHTVYDRDGITTEKENGSSISDYGYENIEAGVSNNGVDYLIIRNPMKLEQITEEKSVTLSFDQIDEIAQSYLTNEVAPDEAGYSFAISDIRYGLARISNTGKDSYGLLPAWYYLLDESETGMANYYTPVVVINAIDGSIIDIGEGVIPDYNSR